MIKMDILMLISTTVRVVASALRSALLGQLEWKKRRANEQSRYGSLCRHRGGREAL